MKTSCEGGTLTETDKKVRDIHHVRRVSSGVVVHLVLFPGFVLDDVQKNVYRRFVIL